MHDFEPTEIGTLLKQSDQTTEINPTQDYQQITVRMWGNGVTSRGWVTGSELGSSRWYVAQPGQFILSKIDARHGAFGLVTPELEGSIVSNDFPLFDVDASRILPQYLKWVSRTHDFIELCKRASEGTTNRVRLKLNRFLAQTIPLPPLEEQRRIVAHIDAIAEQIAEARQGHEGLEQQLHQLLLGVFLYLIEDAPILPMREIAPIVRRPVDVQFDETYHELGIRSFGNGTFHKAPVTGADLGSKRVFQIEPGDLLFSNVFAWEGAIAVAQPEDEGRIGSHRFISCLAQDGIVSAKFLHFYFLTRDGLRQIGEASPGGAGRNRTLGLEKLERIQVPVPSYESQLWFNAIQAEVHKFKRLQAETAAELDALLPSLLDRAFRGEL